MPRNYDNIDAKWDWNGDYLVGKDGDLSDTRDDQVEDLVQQIRIITASALGDWDEHPSRAAGLEDFVGEPNTRPIAQSIRKRVESALIDNNVVSENDLIVNIMPVGPHELFINIGVSALATENNSLSTNRTSVQLVFDTNERLVLFLSPGR